MSNVLVPDGTMTPNYMETPSGLILPSAVVEAELRRHKRPKCVDFFAGAGGMSLGVMQAGVEVMAAVEWSPIAVMTYMDNFCRYGEVTRHFVTKEDDDNFEAALWKEHKRSGRFPVVGRGWIAKQPRSTPGVHHVFVGDVRKLTSKRILDAIGMKPGELDIICGGPPCQGYSRAGKQNVMDPRNSLLFEYARFIVEMKPRIHITENVPGLKDMVTPEGLPVLDAYCRVLADGNFASLDALKKTMEAQLGVAMLRGRKSKPDERDDEDDDDPRPTPKKLSKKGKKVVVPQLDLFA